jgi:PIN domain nuclease of toxin-antitoxin system
MVIDSHALIWWLENHALLSTRALEVFQRGPAAVQPLRICAVTLWEMRMKEHRGDFVPKTPVGKWPVLFAAVPWIEIVDTDSKTWLLAAELDWSHRDPADRIIAATALIHGVPVLTKDRVFHGKDSPVKAVW